MFHMLKGVISPIRKIFKDKNLSDECKFAQSYACVELAFEYCLRKSVLNKHQRQLFIIDYYTKKIENAVKEMRA